MQDQRATHQEWTRLRKELLQKEKDFTRLRDELSFLKRSLPPVKLDKEYYFESFEGRISLADLFRGKSQLIIYHFMFGPTQTSGCKICSHWADQFDPSIPHLRQRDTNFACISRGHIQDLEAYKKKMQWSFEWASSKDNSFNFDFQASALEGQEAIYNFKEYTSKKDSELPGISVFSKDEEDNIFHTYSCYARELETFNVSYRFLDIVPKGRDEANLPWPMAWVDLKMNY